MGSILKFYFLWLEPGRPTFMQTDAQPEPIELTLLSLQVTKVHRILLFEFCNFVLLIIY